MIRVDRFSGSADFVVATLLAVVLVLALLS